MLEYSVAILAGGRNKRMENKNKAFLKIGDNNFIESILKKVSDFDDIMIIANKPEYYRYLGVKVVVDIVPFLGPLGGILTGLKNARFEKMIVLPCDMPFISKKLLWHIAEVSENYDGVVPRLNGYYEPLCAAYSKKCIKLFKESLDNNITKIIDLYPLININYMGKNEIEKYGKYEIMFRNINTPRDYDEFITKV